MWNFIRKEPKDVVPEIYLKKQFDKVKFAAIKTVLSIAILGWVASILCQGEPNPDYAAGKDIMKQVFLVFSVLVLFSIGPYRKIMMKAKGMKFFTKKFTKEQIFINKYFGCAVMSIAMSEIPAVFGLIAAVISKNMNDFYLLASISIIGLMIHFPKYENWEGALSEFQNSQLSKLESNVE